MLIVGNYPFDETEKLFHTQQNVWIKEIESHTYIICNLDSCQIRLTHESEHIIQSIFLQAKK